MFEPMFTSICWNQHKNQTMKLFGIEIKTLKQPSKHRFRFLGRQDEFV